MIVKQYDIYTLELNEFSHISINSIKESIDTYYIRTFLLHSLRGVPDFIKTITDYPQDRMLFELVEISSNQQNNLIYIYESYYTYHDKPTTPKIDKLLEEENFIELCKIGFLDYVTLTKDNFIQLLLVWNKILEQLPPFALLYLDDKNWYNVLPFDTQQAMEIFIATHTEQEII